MGQKQDARSVGARVEELLDALSASGDAAATSTAEELVRTLMEFYGAGLARIVELIGTTPDGEALLRQLTGDKLVGGLLVLHELHPEGTEDRVRGALEKVRPYLGSHSGDVELLDVDDEDVVHLRLEGSCHGCPSSMVTVKLAIEQAIEAAAPEIVRVEVDGVVEEQPRGPGGRPLLPLRAASATEQEPVEEARQDTAAWVDLDDIDGLRSGSLVATRLAGTAAVVCKVDGDLYAYRDHCPGCATPLASGSLAGRLLSCGSCGRRYDVRLAGRAEGGAGTAHLDPLPLLVDGGQVRVAVPAGAAP
ncbi:MAG: NifU family protein [Sciscionella sp.]